tara:strand:+ start:203 stop:859 length:657 start_codon:yes stop_codon:yes gene_type:complete
MEILNESTDSKKTFLSHVFSTTDEGVAELTNVIQYTTMGLVPIVVLNKIVNRFIPEADPEATTLELLAEIFIQIVIMLCGIIVIHRAITYFPTYSGFKYEGLILTNVTLVFLMIVLSIQSKIGLKANILYDRALELWNGPSEENKQNVKKNVRVSQHVPSQADNLDNSQIQNGSFPPAPVATARPDIGMGNQQMMNDMMPMGPVAANGAIGGAFGAAF